MNNSSFPERNLYLRDYIDIIVRGKKIILWVVSISVITTAIISYIMPKVYQGTATIMIMPSKLQSTLSPSQIGLDFEKKVTGEYLGQKPTISLPTHKALLRSIAVMKRVIQKLKLTDKSGQLIMPDDLASNLDVKSAQETNIIQLRAYDNSPSMARDIVNTWAQEYVLYSQELISGEVKGTGDFISDQFEIARNNLTQAEQGVKDFDTRDGLSLLRIEMTQKQGELESQSANVYKLEFNIEDKKNNLQKTNEDMEAMTKNGIWIGEFDRKKYNDKYFEENELNKEQHALRGKVLAVIDNLRLAEEARNNFINDFKINELREEVKKTRDTLIQDRSALAEYERLSRTTDANLQSGGSLERLKQIRGPISQNLPDSTVWEILSLEEKYNFFKTREQFLESKIVQNERELMASEKELLSRETQLKAVDENLNRAQENYNFYLEKFKTLENARGLTELKIADLEFQLFKLRDYVKDLKNEVQVLMGTINQKETKLTELKRRVEIYKKTYDNLSAKTEEARIAKSAQLGEVKLISPAIEVINSVRPNKKQNVFAALAISLMFGVFLVFFQEFLLKKK